MKTFIVKKNAKGFFVECNGKMAKKNLTLQQLKYFLTKQKREYPTCIFLDGIHNLEQFDI